MSAEPSPPSRERPLPADWSAERARDAYLLENGFTVAAYEAAWTPASMFGINFAVPNTRRHRWAIMLHDLHHVATGYGTDLVGEAEISAWELRRGFGKLDLYVGTIVASLALLGLVIAPHRTFRAWLASGKGKRSLFSDRCGPYPELLALSVAELRSRLDVPVTGVATHPRGLNSGAPKPALAGSNL